MNRILTALLLLLSIPGALAQYPAARHWNSARGYAPFSRALPEGILLKGEAASPAADSCRLSEPLAAYTLTFRASASEAPWGFFIDDNADRRTWISVSRIEKSNPLSSAAALRIEATRDGDDKATVSTTADKGIDLYSGPNIWHLVASGQTMTLRAGNRSLTPLFEIPVPSSSISGFGFIAAPGGTLHVESITLAPLSRPDIERKITGPIPPPSATDSLEGTWTVFDRTLDEALLRLGGDYRLAITGAGRKGEYNVVYLGGARVNASQWHPGMIKATLREDPFPGIYSVAWTDASGLVMSHDIKAQLVEPGLLQIQFPYQSSAIRLRRLPRQN